MIDIHPDSRRNWDMSAKKRKEWTWVRRVTTRRSHSESNLLDARMNRRNRAFTEGEKRKEGRGRGREGGKNEKLQVVGFHA